MRHKIHVLAAVLILACFAAAAAAQETSGQETSSQEASSQEPATLERAMELAATEDFAGAARVFEAVTAAEPENATAWFGLGRALYFARQVDRALTAYEKALELGFDPPRTMFHLARAHAAMGNDEKAIDWLRQATGTGAQLFQAIESTPEFRRLEDDPEFRKVVDANRPCNTPGHRKLDFWVGSWRVVVGEGEEVQQVGTNLIQKILNGCALIENWKSVTGAEGKSLFYYNDVYRTWRQVWITDNQRLKEKKLIAELPGGAVRFQGEIPRADGTLVLDRTTLYPLPENRVRQVIEQSIDGGDTWQVGFDAVYRQD